MPNNARSIVSVPTPSPRRRVRNALRRATGAVLRPLPVMAALALLSAYGALRTGSPMFFAALGGFAYLAGLSLYLEVKHRRRRRPE